MHRGYTLAWRKETESDIWLMPPIYHRVWYWIRLNVNFTEKTLPLPKGGSVTVAPGQRITSLRQIAEGVAWSEWGKEVMPNVKTIKTVLEWLESNGMITVESNAKGTVISVVNWDTYSTPQQQKVTDMEQEKVTPTGRPMEHGSDTNNKDKKDKNEKKEPSPLPPKGEADILFDEFWQAYPKKVGKDAARKAWDKRKVDALLSARMVQAIERQRMSDQWQKDRGQYIPNPATWLNQGRWQDEEPEVDGGYDDRTKKAWEV